MAIKILQFVGELWSVWFKIFIFYEYFDFLTIKIGNAFIRVLQKTATQVFYFLRLKNIVFNKRKTLEHFFCGHRNCNLMIFFNILTQKMYTISFKWILQKLKYYIFTGNIRSTHSKMRRKNLVGKIPKRAVFVANNLYAQFDNTYIVQKF